MSNLDRLNELRRTAKALGMTGYGRMKTIDLAAAVEAEQASRREDVAGAVADQYGEDVAQSVRNEQEIDRLRAAHAASTDADEREEIGFALARLGATIVPQGSAAHAAHRENLRAALSDPAALDALAFGGDMVPEPGDSEYAEAFRAPSTPDAEIALAEAVDADDQDAIREIGAAPAAYVQDPAATRYEDVERWTNDRLYEKEEELRRRLTRRTLLGGDRKLTENRLSRIVKQIETRGL